MARPHRGHCSRRVHRGRPRLSTDWSATRLHTLIVGFSRERQLLGGPGGTTRLRQCAPPRQRSVASALPRPERAHADPHVRHEGRRDALPCRHTRRSRPRRLVRPQCRSVTTERLRTRLGEDSARPRTSTRAADCRPVQLAARQAHPAGDRDLQPRQLTPAVIREWHGKLTSPAGPGAITAAKCYRLLHSICNSAVDEEEIPRNPCSIAGAGQESSPERPVASIPQVLALVQAVDERWRALILLAAFCSLRFGELAALKRKDVDIPEASVTIRVSASDLPGGVRHIGRPKSDAGHRTVTIPAALVP